MPAVMNSGASFLSRLPLFAASRSEDIHAAALEEGMSDLKRYSACLLTEGLTSVEEVTSVGSVDI